MQQFSYIKRNLCDGQANKSRMIECDQANNLNTNAPTIAPRIGATTGIQASPQREEPLDGIGRMACSSRGMRSRAGFRPGPVGPPMEVTRPHTMKPTTMEAAAWSASPHGMDRQHRAPNTSTRVPKNSLTK